jgi:hypothetical protein
LPQVKFHSWRKIHLINIFCDHTDVIETNAITTIKFTVQIRICTHPYVGNVSMFLSTVNFRQSCSTRFASIKSIVPA